MTFGLHLLLVAFAVYRGNRLWKIKKAELFLLTIDKVCVVWLLTV